MRTLSLKLLIALLFLGVALTSCDNDDDNVIKGLEDRDIVIDDTQTFNMTKFAASFEQMFADSEHWIWDFSHEIVDGKAVVTYQNIKVLGEFGDKFIVFTHNFNTDGVITSTVGELYHDVYWDDDYEMALTYKFDNEGYIVEFTEKGNFYLNSKPAKNTANKTMPAYEDEVRDIVDLIYNDEKQLVTKHHQALSDDGKMSLFNTDESLETANKVNASGNEAWEEYFTYNDLGQVIKYKRSTWDTDKYEEYIYDTSGNMITENLYYQGSLNNSYSYQYDNLGRLIKRANVLYPDYEYLYEYFDGFYRYKAYQPNNGVKSLSGMYDYEKYEIQIKYWRFEYDGEVFEYCTTKEYFTVEGHNDRLVSKKEYFEGTPENLVLVGYVTVDTRDAANDYKKTKESVYDANSTLLYYITYEVSNNSIQSHQVYLPDGTAISDYAIDYDYFWIHKLVSNLKID